MRAIMIALAVACVVACSAGTSVQIENLSATTLHDVRLTGSGFEAVLAKPLEPGAARRLNVQPNGETGVALSFRAGARRFEHGPQGYFEGNGRYTVRVVVHDDFASTVHARLR